MSLRTWRQILAILACAAVFAGSARAAPPPLDAYGRLPATEEVRLSPDGERLALVTTLGDTRALLVQTSDGKPLVTVNVGDAKIAGLDWAGDDHVVIYPYQTTRLFVDTQENLVAAIAINVDTGKAKPLFDNAKAFIDGIYGRYGFAHIDGRWYGFFGVVPLENDRASDAASSVGGGTFKQRYPNLYRVDLDTGTTAMAARGNANRRSWAIDDQGTVIAKADYLSDSGNWQVYAGDAATPVATGHADYDFRLTGLGRTPGTVLLSSGSKPNAIRELRLADGTIANPFPPGYVDRVLHAPSSHLLLGVTIDGDRPKTTMFDPALDLHIRSIERAFPGATLKLESVDDAFDRFVVHVESPRTSGTYQLIDLKAHSATPVADAYPDVPADSIGTVDVFPYQAADGLPLQGILTLPHGIEPKNLPLIVFPHGGPEARDRVGFDWWAQAMTSRGYAVFQPNFRGSSGFGSALRDAGFGEWGRKMQTDISDGVAALAAQGIVDPKRVCIVGASYGGYAALAGVTLQHGLYRCAASYAGISDIPALLYRTNQREGREYQAAPIRYLDSYLGTATGGSALLEAISPANHAKEADAPILLIHGSHDTVVSIEQSETMASALRGAGKPVEFIQLDGEDHWLSQSKTRLDMLKAVMAFVEKYNPPGP